jgi:excisionase family DNA binding protein
MSEEPIKEGWVTPKEAADATGYAVEYIRILAREDRIPASQVGARFWLIDLDALLEYKRKMDGLGRGRHNPHLHKQEGEE